VTSEFSSFSCRLLGQNVALYSFDDGRFYSVRAPFERAILNATTASHPKIKRNQRLGTAFRSPATTACLQATVAGSKLPTYYLDVPSNPLPYPFGSKALRIPSREN
jgi:hypothetical protein